MLAENRQNPILREDCLISVGLCSSGGDLAL